MNSNKTNEEEKKPGLLEEVFGADVRSLALFRIILGLLVFFDLLKRFYVLEDLYSDTGAFPREAAVQFHSEWFFCLNFLNGTKEFQILLLCVGIIFAFCLMLGYKTKLSTTILWILIISIQNRNTLIEYIGDIVLRLILFWSMFLPLSTCFSIDSALNTSSARTPKRILSFGTASYFLQIAFVFFFSALLKYKNETWRDGTAIFYALNLTQYVTPFSLELLKLPLEYIKYLTLSILNYEFYGSILLFSPIYTGQIRSLLLAGFFCMTIGFGLFLDLEILPFIVAGSLVPLIPTWFWEKLKQIMDYKEPVDIKIYYKKNNELTKKYLMIMSTFLFLSKAKLMPVSNSSQENLIDNTAWFLHNNESDIQTSYNAFCTLIKISPFWHFLTYILEFPILKNILKSIYNVIEDIIKKGGQWHETFLPYNNKTPYPLKISNYLACFFIIYIFLWNMSSINFKYQVPEKIKWIGQLLRIDQRWGMFIPLYSWYSGWFVFPGRLKDGSEIDLFKNEKEISFEKPLLAREIYNNASWKAFYINTLLEPTYRKAFPYLLRYICYKWNQNHEESKQLTDFSLYFLKWEVKPEKKEIDFNLLPNENIVQEVVKHNNNHIYTKREKILLAKHSCTTEIKSAGEILNEIKEKYKEDLTGSLIEYYKYGSLYFAQGNYSEAEFLYKQAYNIHSQLVGENHPELIEVLNTLGTIYSILGKENEAKEISSKVKIIKEKNIWVKN